jgi:hypothetical protein
MISANFTGAGKLDQIGWRHYNNIKKKAMEQEFSWSGLGLSLSIAFFIVITAAFSLNLMFNSISGKNIGANANIIEQNQQNQLLETANEAHYIIFAYKA